MRRNIILFLLLFSINLVGCNNIGVKNASSLSNISTLNSNQSTGLVSSSSSYISTTNAPSSNYESSTTSIDSTKKLFSLYIDNITYNNIGSYETGNYDTTYVDVYQFAHYRVSEADYSSYAMKLIPYVSNIDDTSLPGMIYNIDPILGIEEINITYNSDSSSLNPILRYGNDKSLSNSVEFPASINENTHSIKIDNANYFRIETNDSILHIKDIEIKYSNGNDLSSFEYISSGENNFRINPTRFVGDLVSGESCINIPVSVTRIEDHFIINEFKKYTYYSYEHIVNTPSLAKDAAYTTPEDVSAYYVTFGTWPANYVTKKNYSTAYALFGEDTRCVSTYTRTDGYARYVPWNSMPNESKPRYHELDIALDNYSNNNRGVGRVVVWEYGFNAEGYDNSPVAVYTDDHYATFQEYLNTGIFGNRFNAEMSPTNYKWGSPAILTI